MLHVEQSLSSYHYRTGKRLLLGGYQDEPQLRTRVADWLGCSMKEVALTRNATMGMSYIAMGLFFFVLTLLGIGLARPPRSSSVPIDILRLMGLLALLLFATFGFLASGEPGADPHYVFHLVYSTLFLVCLYGIAKVARAWARG